MSWQEVAAFVEAAASFAVVISLIYLAIQVRLQAKENRMSVVNSLTQQWGEAVRALATQEDLHDIWMQGLAEFEQMPADRRGRFSAILINLTQIFESLHLHHRAGKVDSGLWECFDNRLRDVFATPGAQAWWASRRHWHSRRFQRYVDNAIATCKRQEGRYFSVYGAGGATDSAPDAEPGSMETVPFPSIAELDAAVQGQRAETG